MHRAYFDHLTVPTCSSEIQNNNRRECRKALEDEIGCSINGLILADRQKRILQYYKLKNIHLKNTKITFARNDRIATIV
jgi:hypothetical protein